MHNLSTIIALAWPAGNRDALFYAALLVLVFAVQRVVHLLQPIYSKRIGWLYRNTGQRYKLMPRPFTVDALTTPDAFKYQMIFIVTALRFLESTVKASNKSNLIISMQHKLLCVLQRFSGLLYIPNS